MKLWDLVAAALTKRELDVAYALLAGLSGNEIGHATGMRPRTVKKYLKHMYLKFQIDPCKIQHVVLAVELHKYTR